MATLSDTIQIIIEADDRASASIKGVGDSLGALTDNVGKITGPLASLTTSILAVDAAAVAIGATFIGLAVNETIKFQDSLYLVKKQLDDSGPSIDEARRRIEDLGLAYGTNANNIAESMAGFLAAGYDFQTSAALTETAIRLMIAGELDSVKATDYLTASLAGFRVPAEDAAAGAQQVGDILNKLADISSSRLLDPIAEAFTRVAPIAKTAGLTMEETGAIVTRLVDVFQNGGIAGTAFASILNSLAAPSGAAEEAIRNVLGVTKEFDLQALTSGEKLKLLAENWGGLSDTQQEAAAAIIFGKEQAAKAQVVLGDWAKSQDYLNQVLDQTTGAVGSMGREVEGKLALISTSVDRTREAWRQFLETVGARITDDGSLQGLINNLGLLGQAFKDAAASGALDPLINAVQAQSARLSEIISDVARNLPLALEGIDWSGFIGALEDLGTHVGAIFAGVDLRTPEGLERALQGLVDTGESLIRVTIGIVDGLKPFIQSLIGIVDEANKSSDASKEFAGNILGIASGINLILPAIGSLGDGLSAVGAGLGLLAGANALQTITALENVGAAAAKAASLLGQAGLVAAAGAGGYAVGTVLKEGVDKGVQALTGSEDTLGTWIFSLVNGASDVEKSVSGLSPALQKVGESAVQAGDGFQRAAVPIGDLTASQQELITASDLMGDSMLAGIIKTEQLTATTGALVTVYDQQGNAVEKTRLATGELVNVIRDGEGKIIGYSQSLDNAGAKLDKTAEATRKVTQESDAYRIKIAEIDAEIQKAKLEAFVTLKTTQLETDAERVKSTFESLDNTITNTGNLLGSLFGDLIQADSLRDKWTIQDQIDKENERRQVALDLQKQLAEAEIARINAQTEALQRGDALIRIDGSGLEPELEAFMWQILKRIRVRANADFQDYLLGMGAEAA